MQIKDLPASTTLAATDVLPKETNGGVTQKITGSNLASQVKSLGNFVNAAEMNAALAGKQNALTFDTAPATGSTNPVTSDGITTAIAQSMSITRKEMTINTGAYGRTNLIIYDSGSPVLSVVSNTLVNSSLVFLDLSLYNGSYWVAARTQNGDAVLNASLDIIVYCAKKWETISPTV